MAPRKLFKTSMNLPESSLQTIRELAEEAETTQAEAVRKAVSTDKFLRDTIAKGSLILIKDKDGTMRQLVLR